MRFAAHQPNFMPYVGFWLKMDQADVFGLMPHAQYSKGDYHNRVPIGFDRVVPDWLTVPATVVLGQKISEVRIAKMAGVVDKLVDRYRSLPLWHQYGPELVETICQYRDGDRLIDLNLAVIALLCRMLKIETKIEMMPANTGDPSGDLANWTRQVGADVYLSGRGAERYLDCGKFEQCGLAVEWFDVGHASNVSTVSVVTSLLMLGDDWRTVNGDNMSRDIRLRELGVV